MLPWQINWCTPSSSYMPMRQSGKCNAEISSKVICYKFSPLPYDGHTWSQAFANLIQDPESVILYVQWAISLLTLINHISNMSAILASGFKDYRIITGLNSDKLCDKLVTTYALNWRILVDCFHDVKTLGNPLNERLQSRISAIRSGYC